MSQLGGGNTPPPQSILTTSANRPHTLAFAGSLTFPEDFRQGTTVGSIFRNFGVFVTGRYTSGTSYTGCVNQADDVVLIAVDAATSFPCSSGDFTSEYNGLRLPALKTLDARFTKGFGLGGLNMTAYADVRNILNFTNIIRVFQGNNDIVNAVEFTADSAISATSLQRRSHGQHGLRRGDRRHRSQLRWRGDQRLQRLGQRAELAGGAQLRLPDPGGAALRQR